MGGEREQTQEAAPAGGQSAEEGQRPGNPLIAHAMRKRAIQRKKDGEAGDKEDAAGPPGEEKKEEKKAEEGDKPKEPLKAGETGILTGAHDVKLGDKEQQLAPGTVVEILEDKGEELKVKVYSGQDGAEAIIPESKFQKQPGVAISSKTQKPREDVYREYQGKLWGDDGPKAGDVAQGGIADCYLIAALGSICAANPGFIKQAITPTEPNQKSYTVKLHKKDENGQLQPMPITVDTMLPTVNPKTPPGGTEPTPDLAYAEGKTEGGEKVLWPSLMEKAYAILVEGYAKAGAGGYAGDAMEAITGVEADSAGVGSAKSVIERFKKHQDEGKAVVCGTLGSMSHKEEGGFTAVDGKYSTKVKSHEGEPCSIVPSSLRVTDKKSKNKINASDDGKGKLDGSGVKEGTVTYSSGDIALSFEAEKGPDAPENLSAAYNFRGMISKDLGLYAWHMYMFEKVEGETLIFKNPWGSHHPKPIPAEQFVKLFTGITTTEVPKEEEGPPGGG